MVSNEQIQQGSGLGGMLRLVAMLLVLALAGLGVGVVLDVITLADAGDLAIKLAALAGIAGLASAAISVLTRTSSR